jgi:predicted kinase
MPATLNLVSGPSGAGKTTYAYALARREDAAFLSSMIGRAPLPPRRPRSHHLGGSWSLGRCKALIWSTAVSVLDAGASAVLDLGLMRRADRERMPRRSKRGLNQHPRKTSCPSSKCTRGLASLAQA